MADPGDLTLTAPEPTRPRVRRAKAALVKEVAPSVRLEAAFKVAFAGKFGFEPLMVPARDRALFNKLLGSWSEDVVAALVPFFFGTTDPAVANLRNNYSVPDFYYHAQRLRMMQNGHGTPRQGRQADNRSEIRKAMGKE